MVLMAKKFLLISQVFYPDQVSTANLFTVLCAELVKNGVEVEVWTAHPSYTERKRQRRTIEHNGMQIRYLPSSNFRKSNLAGRIINILSFSLSACINMLFSNDRTPVWTHTTPPFLGMILSVICRLQKRIFVYILLDIYPEGLVRLKKLSGNNPLVRFWQIQFFRSLKRSDRIIVLGRDMQTWLLKKCPGIAGRVVYLPHWQDEEMIVPLAIDSCSIIKENLLSDKFVVQYSGNMGLWNDMLTIGEVVAKNLENVFYIFVGGGIRKNDLIKKISDSRNFILLPFQPNEKFNESLSSCHVHLVSLKEELEGMAVPSKIYGILASGRPVIALVPEESEIAFLVKEENCGIVIDPSDSDGLANAIIRLKSDVDLTRELGSNGRKAFLEKYTAAKAARMYKSILDELN